MTQRVLIVAGFYLLINVRSVKKDTKGITTVLGILFYGTDVSATNTGAKI